MSPKVTITEVGPRDGFQMESTFIPTSLKVEIVDQLADAGLPRIESTSFVHPKVIPQMRDAEEVMRSIQRHPGVAYTALVPNAAGARRAVTARVDAVRIVVCLSETYNQRNVGMSITESLATCAEVLAIAQAGGIVPEVILALSFGCPLEGAVPAKRVVETAQHLSRQGFREISLADSIGTGNPRQVRELVREVKQACPGAQLSLHFHNTRGLGLANVLAGLQEGVDAFDSSLGGLGGCPVVPGGSGNISTEDLVNMLHEMGIETGVDIDRVMAASRRLAGFLGRKLPSYVLGAGTAQALFGRRGQATAGTKG